MEARAPDDGDRVVTCSTGSFPRERGIIRSSAGGQRAGDDLHRDEGDWCRFAAPGRSVHSSPGRAMGDPFVGSLEQPAGRDELLSVEVLSCWRGEGHDGGHPPGSALEFNDEDDGCLWVRRRSRC